MVHREVHYIPLLFAKDQDQNVHLSSKKLIKQLLSIQGILQLISHKHLRSFIYLFQSRDQNVYLLHQITFMDLSLNLPGEGNILKSQRQQF